MLFRDHFGAQLGFMFAILRLFVSNCWMTYLVLACRSEVRVHPLLFQGSLSLLNYLRKPALELGAKTVYVASCVVGSPGFSLVLYFPLIFKSACLASPPLQWRGGVLQELFKNKGSSAFSCNYRDIMLGSVLGKIHQEAQVLCSSYCL